MKDPKKRKIGFVKSHFLDSGAFTLWATALKYHKENPGIHTRWDYYDTDEFWEYVDAYIAFIKKYKIAIDLYANIDVIGNPELTYRNQKYMETKKLKPVPVIHFGTNLSWLKKYINDDYKILGLGGLAKSIHGKGTLPWLDQCFNIICDTPKNLPKVKVHGFGVSSVKLWLRYPWWSIDSTSIHKKSGFGWILVPFYRNGKFIFNKPPLHVSVSEKSPFIDEKGKHLFTMTPKEKLIIFKWLDLIKIPLGNKENKGVINDGTMRKLALFNYYKLMANSLPEWPWPFQIKRKSLLC